MLCQTGINRDHNSCGHYGKIQPRVLVNHSVHYILACVAGRYGSLVGTRGKIHKWRSRDSERQSHANKTAS